MKVKFATLLIGFLALFATGLSVQAQTATVVTDKPDYQPGEYVKISGTGWQPGETVQLHFDETPTICTNGHNRFAVADANGNIYNDQYLIEVRHLGIAFKLTATGLSSNLIAYTDFTDGDVRVSSNSSGTSFKVDYVVTEGTTCNGTLVNGGSGSNIAINNSNTTLFNVSAARSIKITASPNSDQGGVFVNWTGPNGFSSTNPTICVAGTTPTRNYTAVYSTCTSPIIGNQPETSPITYGSNVSFQILVNGTPPLTYKWEISKNNGGTWSNVSNELFTGYTGITSGTLTLIKPPVSMNGYRYRCVVTNGCGSVTSNGIAALNIAKANQTITIATASPTNAVYNSSFTVAASASSGLPVSFSSTTPLTNTGATYTMNSGSGTGVVKYNQAGDDNFHAAPEITTNVIAVKAVATVVVNGKTVTYNGQAHGATGTATGVNDEVLTGLVLGASFTNVPGGTANWTFTNPNYADQDGEAEIVINKAAATVVVNGKTVTYNGQAHGATGTATGVNDEVLTGLVLGASFTNVPGGTANWTFTNPNYADQDGEAEIVINKAAATVVVNGKTVTYNGQAHGATGTATGVNDEVLTGLVLGDSFINVPGGTANWTFTNPNYADQDGEAEIVINKAAATVVVNGKTVTYNGQAHGATGTATGVNDEVLTGLVLGDSFTNVPGGTANWTFTNPNYADQDGEAEIVINKAAATVVVNGKTVTYNGQAHGATGTATGVNDEVLTGLVLGASFTNVPGGTANWTFTNPNYADQDGEAEIVINKAAATVVVNGKTVTYNGQAHGATGTATGVNDEVLTGLVLGDSFINVPGGTANWTFTNPNYADQDGEAEIVINKAAATVVVNGKTVTYNGQAHGATGTATGVNDEVLTGLVLGDSFINVPGGTANWTFTNPNYADQDGEAEIVINKAAATVVVNGKTVTYNGQAHGATGTATGVNDEVLTGLVLGASFTNVPGGTANWTFTNPNYADQDGEAEIVINKAAATVVVNGKTVTYNGQAHGATGTATGVNDEVLTGLVLGDSFINVPGGTANWTFTNPNYADQDGEAEIVINKAAATVVVNGKTVTYNGQAHGATGTATGVNDEVLTGLVLGASFTNVPGGTANWTFTNPNYADQDGEAEIVINKAAATVVVNGKTVTYNGQAHGATGTATGVNDEVLTGLVLGDSFINVPGGTANWTFTNPNYADQDGEAEIVINKAAATVVVNGKTVTYNGQAHGATGTATGVNDEVLTGLVLGDSFINVPGGTANWTFTNPNYADQDGEAEIVINKAAATVVVNSKTVTYNGQAHGATGTATGVNDEVLTGLVLGDSFINVPGGTANWTFTNPNYADQDGEAEIVINKAAATVVVNGKTVTYNGQAHGATGTATGVNDEVLTGLVLGDSFINVPGGTANWTFTNPNYADQDGEAEIVINKAAATVVVNGKTVTYNGQAHGATGTATGVNDEVLTGLVLGDSFINVPGGTANWTFTNPNYADQDGEAEIVINKAAATVVVNGKTVTYNGQAHGATGTATGVNDEVLTGLVLGASFTNVPGGTANWTFTNPNYADQDGEAEIVINKAAATVVVNGKTVTYNGQAHGATGTATGIGGVDLSTGLNLGEAFTNAPGGTANWTFTGGTNYSDKSGSVAIVIGKATTTISVANASGTQGGHVTLTATLKDQSNNQLLSGKVVTFQVNNIYAGTATTNSNGVATLVYNACVSSGSPIRADFAGETNYLASTNTATLTVISPSYVWSGTNINNGPKPLGTVVTPTVTFTGLTLTNVNINWDDNTNNSIAGTFTNSVSLGSHTYTTPGVYAPILKGTDVCGNTVIDTLKYIVIYDPNGGFVTGGGWINSPAGAYRPNLAMIGKANFGFVAKYKKGSNVPEGNTEFQFKAADLNFNSSAYESMSLVVGGPKASYKGSGTINGTGNYKFMLTAIDGDLNGTKIDKIRMKIMDLSGNIIYDNQVGTTNIDESADPTTALVGGSIVIHEVKGNGKVSSTNPLADATGGLNMKIVEPVFEQKIKLGAYPNPFGKQSTIAFTLPTDEQMVTLDVYDLKGSKIKRMYEGKAGANQTLEFEFNGSNLSPGMYLLRLTTPKKVENFKMIMTE